jgi:hypothetical protein
MEFRVRMLDARTRQEKETEKCVITSYLRISCSCSSAFLNFLSSALSCEDPIDIVEDVVEEKDVVEALII